MGRLPLATMILLLALAQCARANSVSVVNLTTIAVNVVPDYGDENLFFSLTGPGTNIAGSGRFECPTQWCSAFNTISLGAVVVPNIGQLTSVSFGNAKLGGIVYNPDGEIGFTPPFFISVLGQVVFPGHPEDSFTACVPATVGPITGTAGSGETFAQFTLNTPNGGSFCTTWHYVNAAKGYQFVNGKFFVSTVPEPGSLCLMVSGLAGLLGVVGTKRIRKPLCKA